MKEFSIRVEMLRKEYLFVSFLISGWITYWETIGSWDGTKRDRISNAASQNWTEFRRAITITSEKEERRVVVEVGHNKKLKKSDTEITGVHVEASEIWTLKLSRQSMKTPSSLTDSRNTIFESPMDKSRFTVLSEKARIIALVLEVFRMSRFIMYHSEMQTKSMSTFFLSSAISSYSMDRVVLSAKRMTFDVRLRKQSHWCK